MSLEHTSTPASEDVDFLTQKINQETPEFGEAHPFAFFIRDEKNKIIAGCNGSMIFGSIIRINYGYIPIIVRMVQDIN